jgi:hypothetical protein
MTAVHSSISPEQRAGGGPEQPGLGARFFTAQFSNSTFQQFNSTMHMVLIYSYELNSRPKPSGKVSGAVARRVFKGRMRGFAVSGRARRANSGATTFVTFVVICAEEVRD